MNTVPGTGAVRNTTAGDLDRAVVRGVRVSAEHPAALPISHVAPPVVVKIGGRALDGEAHAELAPALAALARQGAPAVLVHGGGADVTAWCARLGVESRFENGLRVTDATTLAIAAAVLGGLSNATLVARLRAGGIDAAGLRALDGGTARVVPHAQAARLGFVGEVAGVDPALLLAMLVRGVTPVLASIGADADGQLLNVNADDLAAAVAGALATPLLVLLSDTPGLKLDGGYVPALDAAGLDAALAHPDVQGGMRPKLLAARHALELGAARAWIGSWSGPETLAQALLGAGPGTHLAGRHLSFDGALAPATGGRSR